jgi:hypothetical protein
MKTTKKRQAGRDELRLVLNRGQGRDRARPYQLSPKLLSSIGARRRAGVGLLKKNDVGGALLATPASGSCKQLPSK